jgi:hypothetical protein
MKIHCLFEQSGTFKNEFKKLGFEAYDYDILDDFGQTDYKINLFEEIKKEYEGGVSIFQNISKDDLVMAFFPCIRFEASILLSFRGQNKAFKKWDNVQKMKYCIKLHEELHQLYVLVNQLFIIAIRNGFKMIVENPYSKEHYLHRYWCIKPSVIDKNRRERGDYYVKPTQYWFINCEPKNNLIFEAMEINAVGGKDAVRNITASHFKDENVKSQKVARSMIHPDYANRFIREFIID